MPTKKATAKPAAPVLQNATPADPVAAAPTPAKRPRGRPPLAPGESKAAPAAERIARYRAKGRRVELLLMNPAAIAYLDAEVKKGESAMGVIEAALIEAAKRHATTTTK